MSLESCVDPFLPVAHVLGASLSLGLESIKFKNFDVTVVARVLCMLRINIAFNSWKSVFLLAHGQDQIPKT